MRAGPEKRPYGVDRGKSSSSSSGSGSIGYQQICSPALMVFVTVRVGKIVEATRQNP